MRNLLLAGLTGILLAGPVLADQRTYNGNARYSDYRQDQRGYANDQHGDDRDDRHDDRRDLQGDRRDWQNDRRDWQNDRRDSQGNRRDWQGDRDWQGNRRDWQGDRQAFRGDTRYGGRDWRDDRNFYRYDRDRRDLRWNGNRYRAPVYGYPRGYGYQAWGVGYRLPPAYYGNRYWIDNPRIYRLPQPYRGTRWVRVGPDALLINTIDGLVVQAVRGLY